MRGPTRLRPALVLLAAALATACGSTVQGTSTVAVGGGAGGTGDGLGGSAPAGTSGSAGTTGGTSGTGSTGDFLGGATGGAGGASGTTGGTGTSTGGTTGGPAPSGGSSSGPGVTATKVYIGLIHDVNAGAVNQAAGIGAITTGDTNANYNAIIKDINKHGGVGGRQLVPVYAEFDSTSSQTLDQQYSAVCQKFTHDEPRVFAVDGIGVESYRECIAKAGATMLSTSLPTIGAAALARYPGLIEQGYPNVDRLAAYEVTPLVEQKYFTPWNNVTGQPAAAGAVKVGVLTYNDTVFSYAVDHYLVPALKKLGYDPLVEKVAPVTTASDYGAQGAAVKSAQLAFASQGITHVIPFESNGGLSTLFLPTARSQGYFPRYGVSSSSASEALLEAGAADGSQMNGAVGFGWIPSVDLKTAENPATGPYSGPERRYCLQVMKDNGITFDSGNAETIALSSCADLYLLKRSLDATPALITQATFVRGAEALGATYQRAGTVGQAFRPGRHDPSDKAYHWRYVAACTCFRYDDKPQNVP